MKKYLALLIALICLLSCISAFAETGAARYESLLTNYAWVLADYSYTYHNGSKDIYPNFKWLSSIHLPQDGVYITEDETGNTFITYTASSLGVYCVGELSISADEKTIIVDCISGELHGVFVYQRKGSGV